MLLLCMQVGSTVFVHGGILPEHAAYGLERMNADCRAWMEGAPDARMPAFLGGRRAVVWARDYSNGAHTPCMVQHESACCCVLIVLVCFEYRTSDSATTTRWQGRCACRRARSAWQLGTP